MFYNIATNDANYKVTIREEAPKVNGKRKQKIIWKCPFYYRWCAVLDRCFNPISLTKQPTYIGCSVCEEWLIFSNFKSWMEQQDWEGKELDKDLLVYENKIYSPETCCFISHALNTYLCSSNKTRGIYPIGVSYHTDPKMINPSKHPYKAQISNRGKKLHLGYYLTPEEAHKAWQRAKISFGFEMLKDVTDEKVIKGLLRVINKLQYEYNNNILTEEF